SPMGRLGGADKVGPTLILPTFRALAVPWIASITHPTYYKGTPAAAAFITTFEAAAYAMDTVAAADAADAADAAAYAVYVSALTADGSDPPAYAAATADAHALKSGLSVNALASRRLWPRQMPPWASEYWGRLESALLTNNHDWEVWARWYRDRLDGHPPNEPLELARVLIADDIWKQGPRVVNAHIAELEKKYAGQQGRTSGAAD